MKSAPRFWLIWTWKSEHWTVSELFMTRKDAIDWARKFKKYYHHHKHWKYIVVSYPKTKGKPF